MDAVNKEANGPNKCESEQTNVKNTLQPLQISAELEDAQDSDYFVRELELENDAGSMSFYQKEIGEVNCVVYDSALVLGKYLEKKCLENENYLSGRRILELGSGLGCVGMIAAAYGGKVILTDLPKALPLLELNVRKNEQLLKTKGGTADVRPLDWNSEDESLTEPFDVIVAADCVYYEEPNCYVEKSDPQILSLSRGKVILTDLPKALPLLELNVRKNEQLLKTKGGTADVRPLDWNSEDESLTEPFDVIVAADCVYYEEGVLGLVNTILRLSTPQTEIYLSQENRSYSDKQNQVWQYFCDEILKHFTVKIIPGSQQHEDYRSSDIYIIQLTKQD